MYTAIIAPFVLWAIFTGLAYQAYSQSKNSKSSTNHLAMITTDQVYLTAHFGFSQAIISDGIIYTSGQVGWDKNYILPKETGNTSYFEAQVRQSFLNVEQILKAGNSGMSQVIMLRFFVKDLDDAKRIIIGRFLKNIYPTHYKPATSLIGVAQLAQKGLFIEIEAIAKTKNH